MKRFIALGLVFAILAVGFTAFADPANVGGWAMSLAVSQIDDEDHHTDAHAKIPAHAQPPGHLKCK